MFEVTRPWAKFYGPEGHAFFKGQNAPPALLRRTPPAHPLEGSGYRFCPPCGTKALLEVSCLPTPTQATQPSRALPVQKGTGPPSSGAQTRRGKGASGHSLSQRLLPLAKSSLTQFL